MTEDERSFGNDIAACCDEESIQCNWERESESRTAINLLEVEE